LENISWPDEPEAEEEDCSECGGTGKVEADDPEAAAEDCAECDGTGLVTPDEPTEDQIDEWREAVEGEIQNVMDSAPV
jgi:RecJ-like exonuclease